MMEIRPVREADIEHVQRIAARTIKACFPAFLGEEAASFVDSGLSDQEIADHDDDLFVMLNDGRIVGFSIVLGDLIHLMMIDVTHQRHGHGSQLLAWCEAEMARGGHSVARLESFAGNAQAIAFYLKHGWTETSRDDDAGPFRRAYFSKRLG